LTNDEIRLRTIAQKNCLPITDIKLEQLSRFASLLREWNHRINLISRKDEENIWTNHLLLSVALLFKVEFLSGARILDLGTGGGLPGIPLSILLPDAQFVLLDSIQKKITAVKSMIERLELSNVTAVCSRAEDMNASPGYASAFDAVIARGVSGLENIVSWANPFLKPRKPVMKPPMTSNGRISLIRPAIIAMKGGEVQAEVDKTLRLFPRTRIQSMDLIFDGGEILANSGKRLIIIENE
jgi:16S rRNA (guanine527-N7)-methyltransferase